MEVRLGNVYGEKYGTGFAGNVWDINHEAPCLMTMQGGGRQPHIVEIRKIEDNLCKPRNKSSD